MTEYYLQKKAFNSWSHVTWYASLEEARLNFNKVAHEGNGYSWRMVKADVVEERILSGERPVVKQDEDSQWTADDLKNWQSDKAHIIKNSPVQPVKSSWGSPAASGWGKPTSDNPSSTKIKNSDDGRGARAGSICLVHRADKKRTRCMPDELNAMIAQGWERGGPRTVL